MNERRFVDRGGILEGMNKTVRDSRVPSSVPRSIRNFSLADGRLNRRPGKEPFGPLFKGSMLGKVTPFRTESEGYSPSLDLVLEEEPDTAGQLAAYYSVSPMSYGLLRWHDDFQPMSDRDWTTEMLVRLGDPEPVLDRLTLRTSKNDYDSQNRELRAGETDTKTLGGVVYDQSLTANYFSMFDELVAPTTGNSWNADTFSLSALCVSYSRDRLKLSFDVYDNDTDQYIQYCLPVVSYGYQPGKLVHVAIRYTAADLRLELLIDGSRASDVYLTADMRFAGEVDHVNGLNDALQRDIVLLNEYTVRGGMSSTCRIVDTTDHKFDAAEVLFSFQEDQTEGLTHEANVLCHSPPSGTGLAELRYWHEARTDQEIQQWMRRRLPVPDVSDSGEFDTLVGYFRLDEGSTVSFETLATIGEDTPRQITTHHGVPGYVVDSGLRGGYGISLADGQHLIKSYIPGSLLIEESYKELERTFNTLQVAKAYEQDRDWTLVMEFRTPHTFGQEINKRDGDTALTDAWGVISGAADKVESGRSYAGHEPYALTHGDPFGDDADADKYVDDALSGAVRRTHRAFDQTLWSFEAEPVVVDGEAVAASSQTDATRIAIARGLLTPAGRIAFEYFGWDFAGNDHAQEYRLVSLVSTPLQANSVYRVCWRKRTVTKLDTTDNVYYGAGFAIDIIIDGPGISLPAITSSIVNNTIAIGGRLVDDPVDIPVTDTDLSERSDCTMKRGWMRDVVIGSSYVNDVNDRSWRATVATGGTDAPVHTFLTQRYLSPWQDQPGQFTLGSFQFWCAGLSDGEVRRAIGGEKKIQNTRLLYDIDIRGPGTDIVVSRGLYNVAFSAGYKSWGEIQSHQNDNTLSPSAVLRTGHFLGDRLGWLPLDAPFINDRLAACEGLAPYASTLRREYGILTAFDGTMFSDRSLAGDFRAVRHGGVGPLNDFSAAGQWRSAQIADTTVLTSRAGTPKVWDGNHLTHCGFRGWTGGSLRIESQTGAITGQTLVGAKWYALRIVYFAESEAILDVSPPFAVFTEATTPYIDLVNLSPSPDPRVTSMVVYMTKASASFATRAEALQSGAFFPTEHVLVNLFWSRVNVYKESKSAQPLDLERTPFPSCAHVAAAFNRIYLAGDALVPDIIYFSYAGIPQAIDTLRNRLVLEDGSGDEIVALRYTFGALYAFKPGSIWAISEPQILADGTTLHDPPVRVASIGPVSADAIALITIPESGRVAMAFWSRHGPYLFDGVNVQPIGYPMEGPSPFADVLDQSVILVHDIEHREIAFLFQSTGACCTNCDTTIRNKAIVFNYRNQSWVEETGVLGSVSLSSDFTADVSGLARASSGVGSPVLRTEPRYLPLVGTEHGRIVLWGSGTYDGLSASTKGEVTAWDGTSKILTVTWDPLSNGFPATPPDAGVLRGLWVTVISAATKEHFLAMASWNEAGTVTLDPRGCALPFEPESGDRIQVGLPACDVEFPWDSMDALMVDKQLLRTTFWGDGVFQERLSIDWTDEKTMPWRPVTQQSGQRHHVEETAASEVFKLRLLSFSETARLDSYGFHVTFRGDGNKSQRP